MITTLLCEWFSGPSVMPHWTTDDLQTVLPKPRVIRSCIQQGESLLKKIVNCVYVFSKVVITCANCCCFLFFWNVRKAWNKTITKKQTFTSCFFPTLHPPLLHPFHPPPCFARKLLILEWMCHVNYTECQIDSITRCAFRLNKYSPWGIVRCEGYKPVFLK